MFSIYLKMGIDHVFGLEDYTHILFLMAIAVPFLIREWRKLLILLTAFTIGHCLTLVLAILEIISFDPYWIDLFIPATIFLGSIQTLIRTSDHSQNRLSLYPLVVCFGLIHGLAASNTLQAEMGLNAVIVYPLFAFNLGVELAQVCFLLLFVSLGYLLVDKGKLKHKYWVIAISLFTALTSLYWIVESIQ